MTREQRNFRRTIELIATCRELKLAYLRSRHPDWTERRIERELGEQAVRRKNRQWTTTSHS